MPYWGWILFIVGLSILAFGIFFFSIHAMHRQVPARQAAEGDPGDISAPLARDIAKEQDAIEAGDAMTAREIERERAGRLRASDRVATYEITFPSGTGWPAEVVEGLPVAEPGEILYHRGCFWRVEAIEPSQSSGTEGRLLVSLTTNAPKATAPEMS
jgi:hypothetical protein